MGGQSSSTKNNSHPQVNQENLQQRNTNSEISKKNLETKRVISKEEENELDIQFQKLKTSKILPIENCSYINNDKTHWLVVFLGTEGSSYENGYFKIEFIFKNIFPKNGPEAKFITKMFHPNIASNGHVCMDLLNNWNEKTSMENILYGILEILDNPVPEGAYSKEARKKLEENSDIFWDIVDEYTAKYATEGF
jgi:ubiquitin-protein ligase